MQGHNDIPEDKKRNRTWPVKYSEEEIKAFEEIKEATDRPIGYIIRELSLRGLAAFQRDGKLKEPVGQASQPLEHIESTAKPATITARNVHKIGAAAKKDSKAS